MAGCSHWDRGDRPRIRRRSFREIRLESAPTLFCHGYAAAPLATWLTLHPIPALAVRIEYRREAVRTARDRPSGVSSQVGLFVQLYSCNLSYSLRREEGGIAWIPNIPRIRFAASDSLDGGRCPTSNRFV